MAIHKDAGLVAEIFAPRPIELGVAALLPADPPAGWAPVTIDKLGPDGAVSVRAYAGPLGQGIAVYFRVRGGAISACRITSELHMSNSLYPAQRWCFEQLGSSLPPTREPPVRRETSP